MVVKGFMRRCYIAKYSLAKDGKALNETILKEDSYYSKEISKFWDELVSKRHSKDPMLQCWYSDMNQTICMGTTNQPFKLD